MLRKGSLVRVGLAVCAVVAGAACGLNNSTGPSAMVTDVTAEIASGQSGTGGPFDFSGTITATDATTVTYRWELSNGDLQPVQQLQFAGAGSLSTTFSFEPGVCFGNDQYLWARLDVLEPNVIESAKVSFKRNCVVIKFAPLSPL